MSEITTRTPTCTLNCHKAPKQTLNLDKGLSFVKCLRDPGKVQQKMADTVMELLEEIGRDAMADAGVVAELWQAMRQHPESQETQLACLRAQSKILYEDFATRRAVVKSALENECVALLLQTCERFQQLPDMAEAAMKLVSGLASKCATSDEHLWMKQAMDRNFVNVLMGAMAAHPNCYNLHFTCLSGLFGVLSSSEAGELQALALEAGVLKAAVFSASCHMRDCHVYSAARLILGMSQRYENWRPRCWEVGAMQLLQDALRSDVFSDFSHSSLACHAVAIICANRESREALDAQLEVLRLLAKAVAERSKTRKLRFGETLEFLKCVKALCCGDSPGALQRRKEAAQLGFKKLLTDPALLCDDDDINKKCVWAEIQVMPRTRG